MRESNKSAFIGVKWKRNKRSKRYEISKAKQQNSGVKYDFFNSSLTLQKLKNYKVNNYFFCLLTQLGIFIYLNILPHCARLLFVIISIMISSGQLLNCKHFLQ